jgi:hypothetical protein
MSQPFPEFIFYGTLVYEATLYSCAQQTKDMSSEIKYIQILLMNQHRNLLIGPSTFERI